MQKDHDASGNMSRYTAYRAEAAKCRLKADSGVERREYWLAEAQKWDQRAEDAKILSPKHRQTIRESCVESKSEEYRENARNCNELAETAESEPAKKRYRGMAAAWLDLAEEQDWLDGQMPRP